MKWYHVSSCFTTNNGMNETKILVGRRYGGCSIYIHKKLNGSGRLLDGDSERIYAVLYVLIIYLLYSWLFIWTETC